MTSAHVAGGEAVRRRAAEAAAHLLAFADGHGRQGSGAQALAVAGDAGIVAVLQRVTALTAQRRPSTTTRSLGRPQAQPAGASSFSVVACGRRDNLR
jgi:hypothetical protein